MKVLIKEKGLNPDNWRYIRYTPEELTIIHKHTFTTRVINFKEGA